MNRCPLGSVRIAAYTILIPLISLRYGDPGSLRNAHVGDNGEIELAYALLSEFWGKGLVTEMATASLKVGFEQLGLQDVVCFTLPTNRAAQHIMEKVGFKYDREIIHVGLPHVFYRITASEW